MSIYLDKLAHAQVVINCPFSIAQMCTREDRLAHILGSLYFDDVMSYDLLTKNVFLFCRWTKFLLNVTSCLSLTILSSFPCTAPSRPRSTSAWSWSMWRGVTALICSKIWDHFRRIWPGLSQLLTDLSNSSIICVY